MIMTGFAAPAGTFHFSGVTRLHR